MFHWAFHKPGADSMENWTIRTPIKRYVTSMTPEIILKWYQWSRAVKTSDFAFYNWCGCQRSRHMPTTSVPYGFERLNRNWGASSSGHQSHHSKGGGSSPATSGEWPSWGGSPSLRPEVRWILCMFFRCASICWFEVVSQSVSQWVTYRFSNNQ